MTEGSDIKGRMTQYLDYKDYKPGWVEKHAMLGNGYLRNTAGGYTATKLAALATVCKDLNLNWLITGQGDMLIQLAAQGDQVQGDKIEQNQSPFGGPQLGKQVIVQGTTATEHDRFHQQQAPNGGPQLGCARNVDYTEATFFDTYNTIEVIENVDMENVPGKYRPLVTDIKNRSKQIDLLSSQLDEMTKKREAAEANVNDLNRQVIEAKNQTIELLTRAQKLG